MVYKYGGASGSPKRTTERSSKRRRSLIRRAKARSKAPSAPAAEKAAAEKVAAEKAAEEKAAINKLLGLLTDNQIKKTARLMEKKQTKNYNTKRAKAQAEQRAKVESEKRQAAVSDHLARRAEAIAAPETKLSRKGAVIRRNTAKPETTAPTLNSKLSTQLKGVEARLREYLLELEETKQKIKENPNDESFKLIGPPETLLKNVEKEISDTQRELVKFSHLQRTGTVNRTALGKNKRTKKGSKKKKRGGGYASRKMY